jgi:hypothetical protein
MKYADGNDAKIGDVVAIDDQYHGVVVASIDSDEYSLSTGVRFGDDEGLQ